MLWRTYFKHTKNRTLFGVSVIALVFTLFSYGGFLRSVERREGVVFADPVHHLIAPFDCTWPIFFVLYASILTALFVLRKHPDYLMRGIRAYTLLIGLRMMCMWLLPLNPPVGMLPLIDPFAQLFASGEGGSALSRDLFFSGHTSLVTLLALLLPNKTVRYSILAGAVVLGFMLVVMRAHYTIDVVVAPMAAVVSLLAVGGFVPLERE